MVRMAVDASVTPRGEKFVIYREPGTYAAFPRLAQLAGGRLAVGLSLNTARDHHLLGEWRVLISGDAGATWAQTEDLTLPLHWPGSSSREKWDRATHVLPDGTWLAVGAVGWQAWPAEREGEAEAEGLAVHARGLPGRPDLLAVDSNLLFVQRSRDKGKSWQRREISLTRAGYTLGFPRHTTLEDGTLLLPFRQRTDGSGQALVLRVTVTAADEHLRLYPLPRDLMGATGSEAALLEVAPHRVLLLMRANDNRGGTGHLLSCWSDDGGRTWTYPIVTDIWGYPPHLLRLADGRILCTYGHRRPPLGVQAVISSDAGETWDVAHPAILADDGETTDLGYPMSVQLPDGSIYTAYYITHDGVTYSLGTRWELPW
ncbi:MAG: exo-alpha-sialidase [Chloroflexi bacterium]|nr:exo-alpha-sialidase [Chloroflexota bacterium]